MTMLRTMLKSKIHRATVTGAYLDYDGSLGVDARLCKLANLLPGEKVDIYNITNGERFSTYIIAEKEGSGSIILNGAAARLGQKGDKIIIASYCIMADEEVVDRQPAVIFVDGDNQPGK